MSVLCLGEILIDCIDGCRLPGGAPANVACHVAALGTRSALVSRVGDDPDGKRLCTWLTERKIFADLLQTDPAGPTGTVEVMPGPRYEIADVAAWDAIKLTDANRSAARGAGALVFGTLAQRRPESRKTIRELVATARSANVPALCDLNLREPYWDEETVLWCLRNCDLLKLNREELAVVSRMLQARGEHEKLFAGLLREFSIPRGVLTLGGDGAVLSEGGDMWRQPAGQTGQVADTVGAGDAFTAILSVALARKIPLRQAGPAAAALASHVVSESGATPELPPALADRINAMLCA